MAENTKPDEVLNDNEDYYCIFSYDGKSLVNIASNVESQILERSLVTFLTKKLIGAYVSTEGNVCAAELGYSEDEGATKEFSCFYSCLKKIIPTISSTDTSASIESVNSTEYQYVVCLLSSDLTLDLFRPELQKFSTSIIDELDLQNSDEAVVSEPLKSKLNSWPHDTVHYIMRCLERFQVDVGKLFYAAVMNMNLNIITRNEGLRDDVQRFVQLCSLSDYFDESEGSTTSAVLVSEETSDEKIVLEIDDESYQLSLPECPEYCRNLANELLKCKTVPHLVKQHIENFKFMIFQDLNLFRRILNEAEQNHYALYRTYIFLSHLSYASIILMHAKAHLISNDAGLEVIQILEEHLGRSTAYNFSTTKPSSKPLAT